MKLIKYFLNYYFFDLYILILLNNIKIIDINMIKSILIFFYIPIEEFL